MQGAALFPYVACSIIISDTNFKTRYNDQSFILDVYCHLKLYLRPMEPHQKPTLGQNLLGSSGHTEVLLLLWKAWKDFWTVSLHVCSNKCGKESSTAASFEEWPDRGVQIFRMKFWSEQPKVKFFEDNCTSWPQKKPNHTVFPSSNRQQYFRWDKQRAESYFGRISKCFMFAVFWLLLIFGFPRTEICYSNKLSSHQLIASILVKKLAKARLVYET